MKRSRVVVAGSLWVLAATLAGAQPPPAQPTNMISPGNPILISGDGVPDGNGELRVVPSFIPNPAGGPSTARADFGSGTCNGRSTYDALAKKTDPARPYDSFGRTANANELTATQFDTADPVHRRPRAFQYNQRDGRSTGLGTLIDSNGDHRYEKLQLTGTKNGQPVNITLDISGFDVNRDGVADFARTNNLAALGFRGCTNNFGEVVSEIFIPCAHESAGECSFIEDLDGNGESDPDEDWGPMLAVSGASVVEVPTVSGVGLAGLALLLLVGAVRQLRRGGFAAGV